MEAESAQIVRIAVPTIFPVGPANIFLVKADPPVLVDAGFKTDEGYAHLERRLAEHGVAVRDIGAVLLTHGHVDHVGLLERIVAEAHPAVYAHPDAVRQYARYDEGVQDSLEFLRETMVRSGVPGEAVERFAAFRMTFRDLAGPVDIRHPVEDGTSAAGFVARHVPGHSASDVLYCDRERRIAFTGDHLLKGLSPNPLLRRGRDGQGRARSLIEYQRSLRITRNLDIETCYPGHGVSFSGHQAVIDRQLERHERRTGEIRALLENAPATPYEIAMLLFPELDNRALHLGLAAALGHLDILEDRREAAARERDGVLRYERQV